MVPLGYATENKKLVVVEEEAERVRLIFTRYLDLGSIGALLTDLRERGVVTKLRRLAGGKVIGGIPFTRGPLAYLLRNRFYIGEIVFKGAIHPAEHPAILHRALFEAVQQKLAGQRNGRARGRSPSGALLAGKLFDDRGHRMAPTHANKAGVRYRYYVSSALHQGRAAEAGSVRRVPAIEIERLVADALRTIAPGDLSDRELVEASLDRAIIHHDRIELRLLDPSAQPLTIPWRLPCATRHRAIVDAPDRDAPIRPMRAETRATLLAAIGQARSWLAEIVEGAETPDTIAIRESCSRRHVASILSLAHLAPDIVEAAIASRLPHGIGQRNLTDLSPVWSRQRSSIGLAPTT